MLNQEERANLRKHVLKDEIEKTEHTIAKAQIYVEFTDKILTKKTMEGMGLPGNKKDEARIAREKQELANIKLRIDQKKQEIELNEEYLTFLYSCLESSATAS